MKKIIILFCIFTINAMEEQKKITIKQVQQNLQLAATPYSRRLVYFAKMEPQLLKKIVYNIPQELKKQIIELRNYCKHDVNDDTGKKIIQNLECIESFLLLQSKTPNFDRTFRQLFQYATTSGSIPALDYFVTTLGCGLDMETSLGKPLAAAIMFGTLDTVKWLIDKGASVNEEYRDRLSATPLHLAVNSGYDGTEDRYNLVEYMLQRGVNARPTNCFGKTALNIVDDVIHDEYSSEKTKSKYRKIRSLLLEYRAISDSAQSSNSILNDENNPFIMRAHNDLISFAHRNLSAMDEPLIPIIPRKNGTEEFLRYN